MEMLKSKKGDHYAKTQNLRDEAGALDYLETAGDVLIKDLARKQISMRTTLEEQLQIRQEFEKGDELKPWSQTGLSSLEGFKVNLKSEEASSSSSPQVDYSFESIKSRSGLTRHELELGIAEKPGSRSSKLYRFALGNLKPKKNLEPKPDGHPLNRLKEIEAEMFREKKQDEEEYKSKRKKRKRKRPKKKVQQGEAPVVVEEEEEEKEAEAEEQIEIGEEKEAKSYRPSLWDVKDVKKLCRKEKPGCKAPKMYTIKNGKIIEVSKSPNNS